MRETSSTNQHGSRAWRGETIMRKIYRVLGGLIICTAALSPAAEAHHPGIGGGGGGGIVTIGAGTLEAGQFAASFLTEYTGLRQLSDATLLATAGQDVHSLRSIESYTAALSFGLTNDLMVTLRLPWIRRTNIRMGEQDI